MIKRRVSLIVWRLAAACLLLAACAGERSSPAAPPEPTAEVEATAGPEDELEPTEPAEVLEPAPEEVAEAPTLLPAEPGLAVLTLSTNPNSDLLFYITREDGSRLYYHGYDGNGAMRLTHLIVDDGAGNLQAILFTEDLLPVQWILPDMTIVAYPPEDEGALFDPHQAFHVAIRDGQEAAAAVDIVPADLEEVVDAIEAAGGVELPGAHAFLQEYPLSFQQLLARAREAGPEQPRFVAAAAGLSSAAAALSLAKADFQARAPGLAAPPRIIFGEVIKVGAGAAGGALAGALGHSLDPGDGPSIGVLLCRGAAKYGTCHYVFFRRSHLDQCLRFCTTSLGCFTDICMPMDISADLADDFGGNFGGH